MEKLQLIHLAPYLPYQLMIWKNERVMQLTGLSNPYKTLAGYFISGEVKNPKKGFRESSSFYVDEKNLDKFKPILKPMDILSISPIIMDEMNRIHTVEYNGNNTFVEPDSENNNPFSAEYLPYESLLILFKNHFDVFGLINLELAVNYKDIPELLNP